MATLSISGAILGSAGSTTAQVIAQKAESRGWSIGSLLHSICPTRVVDACKSCINLLQSPIKAATRKVVDLYLNNPLAQGQIGDAEFITRATRVDKFLKLVVAPVFEETTYRGLIQGVGAKALTLLSIPFSNGISAVTGNILFGLAHLDQNEQFNSRKFTKPFAAGVAMAAIQSYFGLPTAILAHMLHNCLAFARRDEITSTVSVESDRLLNRTKDKL